ncbi:hypothetical protein LR68_01594 [Anoxybacillus sp. BCO1]|nr:hypothetical protein LR68_01594 [Anoxybacillus sp. BCO1]
MGLLCIGAAEEALRITVDYVKKGRFSENQ